MHTKLVRGAAAGVALGAVVASGLVTSWWGTVPVEAGDLRSRTCELSGLAGEDPSAAGEGFMRDVHGPLHTVARELLTTDRPAAARLLEAKRAVESAIDGEPNTSRDLPDRLSKLAGRLPGAAPCEEI
ncbi:MAG: hypothetical protein WEB03_06490 [Nitriliruptor sp.]|uniref:hypothetical protein n=1 Tax=Nitriliruptor sp. TaxID=2448056 RepID=UPI00349FF127